MVLSRDILISKKIYPTSFLKLSHYLNIKWVITSTNSKKYTNFDKLSFLAGHFDHVTMISESCLREQMSVKCNYFTYFRAFILLYFVYTSPYFCTKLWIEYYSERLSESSKYHVTFLCPSTFQLRSKVTSQLYVNTFSSQG